tara:strand:- start:909 stop:1511 length:603 start_codon:yes stop_codon:yes gene_type:complete
MILTRIISKSKKMSNFYFDSFPRVTYDIKKNGKLENVTNIMLRYKLNAVVKSYASPYYDYVVEDGERADTIAFGEYEDYTLDWLIYLTNDIIDPMFDWPMSQNTLQKYIVKKYGSIPTAQATVHEYRKILNEQSVLFDGTIVPKRTLVVDETTYNTLSEIDRESISKYTYENELNDSKRQIKLISRDFVSDILLEFRNTI